MYPVSHGSKLLRMPLLRLLLLLLLPRCPPCNQTAL
jgi:hypothetical protein